MAHNHNTELRKLLKCDVDFKLQKVNALGLVFRQICIDLMEILTMIWKVSTT